MFFIYLCRFLKKLVKLRIYFLISLLKILDFQNASNPKNESSQRKA
jgi:hypothetical protein